MLACQYLDGLSLLPQSKMLSYVICLMTLLMVTAYWIPSGMLGAQNITARCYFLVGACVNYSLLDTLWYARSTEYHCTVLLCLLVLVLITAYWIPSGMLGAQNITARCYFACWCLYWLQPIGYSLVMLGAQNITVRCYFPCCWCVQTETTVCRPRLLCADRDCCVQTETTVCRPRLFSLLLMCADRDSRFRSRPLWTGKGMNRVGQNHR